MRLRLNIRNYSAARLAAFRKAMVRLQSLYDNRGYNYLAGLHGIPNFHCWHHQEVRNDFHGVRLFLPWHRAYLLTFEQFLMDAAEDEGLNGDDVTMPWWDWRSQKSHAEGVPKAYSESMDSEGHPNPLHSFHIRQLLSGVDERTRRFPQDPNDLPPGTAVEDLRAIADFNDFNDELEGVHDMIHGWVGGYKRDANGLPIDLDGNPVERREDVVFGSMGSVAVAAFDPIFWAHHTMIDRIWRLWQMDHGIETGFSSVLQRRILEPFNMTVGDVLDVSDLGYDYAGVESGVLLWA